ncbi:AraC family transcriptional regulator [Paenibacillus protaetiae]|uniref:AraC family transcriptional regulator n=1 Tax=Paenibacillus protaetiae TaxID=2509456 RepID=A0A4P6EZH1_9BACL|nr:helix-turn-helix domain-containing protein [Paenibacillus protaetiae]QAY68175.1 AraC family transcriptional regulator [Paenibacillus protaetiae]
MIDFTYRNSRPIEPEFHSHTFYEVYYFHEGICNYLIGDKVYALAPGDLIVMYGMTLHCSKIDPSVPYVRSIIHFEPSFVKPYTELPNALNILLPFEQLRNYRIRLQGEQKERMEAMLEAMNGHKQRGGQISDNRLTLAFVDMLYFIYDQCMLPMKDKADAVSSKERAVQDIVTALESCYTDDLHLEQLEDKLHLTKSYLSKIFKEVTGVTIFQYVYRRRINEAKILFLLQPDLSVTEAGIRLGFKHLAHFSRMFKQQTGMSPEEFKKTGGYQFEASRTIALKKVQRQDNPDLEP